MAITRVPREFLAVWNDDGTEVKGATFEEAVFIDGQHWKNETTPVASENFGDFGSLFSNQLQIQHDAIVAEKAELLSEKAALESQLAAKTEQAERLAEDKATLQAEKTDLIAQLATLNSEKLALASQVETLTQHLEDSDSQVESLTNDKVALTAELATSQARITFLTNELPFDPRVISVTAFRARLDDVLDAGDIIALYASEANPTLKAIAATITNWPITDPIRLDSPELVQPLGILVQYELLNAEEVASLRRDASRAEAYFAPE